VSRPASARRAGARAAGVRPLPARRVSGPATGRHPRVTAAGAVAAPPLVGPVGAPRIPGRPGAPLARLRALPDHRLVDRLLRSRAWICLVALALGGIVAMQVSLLKLNAGISRAVETSAGLERANADLEAEIARLGAGERIRGAAASAGMVLPPAGAVEYVGVRPQRDATLAARTMRPPSPAAESVMANGGRAPAAVVPAAAGMAAGVAPAAPAAPGAPASAPAQTPAAGIAAAPGTTEAPGTVVPTPAAPAVSPVTP